MSGRFKRFDNAAGIVLLCVVGGFALFAWANDTPAKQGVPPSLSSTIHTDTGSVKTAENAATPLNSQNNQHGDDKTQLLNSEAQAASSDVKSDADSQDGGTEVSGTCEVDTTDSIVMTGDCSGLQKPGSLFLTAAADGCSLELTTTKGRTTGKLFAYRDTCMLNKRKGIELDHDVDFGEFAYDGKCWIAEGATICLTKS